MTRAEELADEAMRGSCCEGERDAVLNAIRTYGEEVRAKLANVVEEELAYALPAKEFDHQHGAENCPACRVGRAIENMELP